MVFADNGSFNQKPIIKVIGVGGGGGNAVNRMIENDVQGVEFIVMNTDAQVLKVSECENRLQLGKKLTRGLGAGAKPEVGRNAALESQDEIRAILEDTDMVFITAGMGGGTGTGAAPIIAEIAKEMGCLTVGVVTKPFEFEGKGRMKAALEGIEALKPHVDTLVIIPNQKLLSVVDTATTIIDAFRVADNTLRSAVQSIAEIITVPALINVDFADVKTIMQNKGTALMGIGAGKGENKVIEAARSAIHSELLEVSIDGATDAIVVISASSNITLMEHANAIQEITDACDGNINIIYGCAINDSLEDEAIVTVIATGYDLKAKDNEQGDLATDIFKTKMPEKKPEDTLLGRRVEEPSKPVEQKSSSLPDWLKKTK